MKALLSFLILCNLCFGQITWTKHPTPVLPRSAIFPSWKGIATADAFVMEDNDTLKMWYSGSGWLSASDNCAHVRMGYAWSLNGINWNEYINNPVLNISADTSMFDSDGIETPCVIKDTSAPPAQRYKLWYAGRRTKCSSTLDHKFGYAYSPDGRNWTKYSGNPILIPGTTTDWYNSFISNPSVIKEGSVYKMWFSAPDAFANSQPTDGKVNIAYATSSDGINWSVHPNPVIIAGSQMNWDTVGAAEPNVLKIGNFYHMFYSVLNTWNVENFQMGYAYSLDGVTWTKSNQNPVLTIGGPGKWDRYWASHAGVIYDASNSKFKMWYTGRDTATITSLSGYYWDIGYAESSDNSTEITGLLIEKNITLFPNPANEKIQFEKEITISVFDAYGKQKYKGTTKELNVSEWDNGVYLISNGQLTTKFIVLH